MTATPPDLRGTGYANSRFEQLAGVRTHVQVWQPEDATPTRTVVGLHHFYGSSQTYHRLGPLLAEQGMRLVAFDRVGFGLTDRPDPGRRLTGPESPYTRGFAVRQALALLDLLEVDRAVVTGTSMGGTVTLELALAHPDRVAHAVPCSAPLTGDASAPAWARTVLRQPLLARMGSRVVRRLGSDIGRDRVAQSWHDPGAVETADVDAHARFRDHDGWDRALWWKWVADAPPALLDRLPELAAAGTRVTAVGATHDRVVRPGVARRTAELAGGRYVELACGHLVHVEGAPGLAGVLADVAGVA